MVYNRMKGHLTKKTKPPKITMATEGLIPDLPNDWGNIKDGLSDWSKEVGGKGRFGNNAVIISVTAACSGVITVTINFTYGPTKLYY
jgi:hypothetical protein